MKPDVCASDTVNFLVKGQSKDTSINLHRPEKVVSTSKVNQAVSWASVACKHPKRTNTKPEEMPKDMEDFPDLAHALPDSDKKHPPLSPRDMDSNKEKEEKGDEEQEKVSQNKRRHKKKKRSKRNGDCKKDDQISVRELPKSEGHHKGSGKKSKAPIQLDLANMLTVLEQKHVVQKTKQDSKPIVLTVGAGLPVMNKDLSSKKKMQRLPETLAHNPLDSTSPMVKKGKQREVPKAKKPTPLKRIILKEREERKQKRLVAEMEFPLVAASDKCEIDVEDVSAVEVKEEQQDYNALRDAEDNGSTEEKEKLGEEELVPELILQNSSQMAHLQSSPKIHSRKFREYCSQVISQDVDECVVGLLRELVRFQDRLYQKDPMKARMKRRLVMGLREVLKHLRLHRVKCVIISPNCERSQSKGGLDEALHTIIDACREQNVPFVFALSRKALGHCLKKTVPVSLVGIFNYDGAQDIYHKMIELSSEARRAYEAMITNLEKPKPEEGCASFPNQSGIKELHYSVET